MTSLEEMMEDTGGFSAANAQAHLSLLRVFCQVYTALGTPPPLQAWLEKYTPPTEEARTNQYLMIMNYRYTLYLDLLVTLRDRPKNEWPLPPWDVAVVWHTHLLSPINFAKDISGPRWNPLVGALDFPLEKLLVKLNNPQWDGHQGSKTFLLEDLSELRNPLVDVVNRSSVQIRSNYNPFQFALSPPPTARFSFDLTQAVKRQIAFAKKITAIYPFDPVPDAMLNDCQGRYVKFMNLFRVNATPCQVPAMDIDLFWHTHQLTPSNYLPWCTRHVGRPINHDDTVATEQLSNGLELTIAAWETNYSEDYLIPDASLVSQGQPSLSPLPPTKPSIPGPTTLDRAPPPGLTPAQYQLWLFDVARQNEHEQSYFEVQNLRAHLTEIERRVISLNHESNILKFTGSFGGSSQAGFRNGLKTAGFRNIMNAYMQNQGELNHGGRMYKALQDEREDVLKRIKAVDDRRRIERSRAGKARWPLLVSARAGGPIGRNNLNFPIYAATWYHNKPLEYYNYINGGRNGGPGIEGGGIPLGGAMCGSSWKEGWEPPPTTNSGGGMCGGGCSG